MNVGDSNAATVKRSRRPLCVKCGQVVTKNQFDKCMWCGEPLPDNLKLTNDERTAILEKQQQQKRQLIAKENERLKKSTEWSLF